MDMVYYGKAILALAKDIPQRIVPQFTVDENYFAGGQKRSFLTFYSATRQIKAFNRTKTPGKTV